MPRKKKITSEEKHELLAVIKGDKKKYQIHISGYGGEIVMGRITANQYEFWKDREDLSDHACDWENELSIPDDLRICRDGYWHDIDDLAHENGCELSSSCWITVYDEEGGEVWSSALDYESLENGGVGVDGFASEEYYVEYDSDAEYAFLGQSIEKGTFNTYEIETIGNFEPAKLSLSYIDVEGWSLINGVSYESVILDDTGGYSTTGKSSEYKVFKIER